MQLFLKSLFSVSLQFAAKIDQVEDFLQYSQEFENPESLKELLHQHKLHTKGIEEGGSIFFYKEDFELRSFWIKVGYNFFWS